VSTIHALLPERVAEHGLADGAKIIIILVFPTAMKIIMKRIYDPQPFRPGGGEKLEKIDKIGDQSK
jgi:hypothetical protein